MKTSSVDRFILASALAFSICFGLVVQVSAQSSVDLPINVLQIRGSARYSSNGHKWQTVKKGALLSPGVVIQTAGSSTVDLRLGDGESGFGSELQLAPDSALAINRLNSERTNGGVAFATEMNLLAGQITCRVGKWGPGSRYEIQFPTGVAGARGGDTVCRISASGLTDVTAGQVVVVVSTAQGSMLIKGVSAGQRFDPATGAVGDTGTPAGFASPPAAQANPIARP